MDSGRIGAHGAADRVRFAASLALAAIAYWALARAGLALGSKLYPTLSPIWPSAGFAVALLIAHGTRYVPAVFAGALAVNLQAGTPPVVSVGIAAANTLGPALATVLLRRHTSFQPQFPRLRDALSLIVVGALLSSLLCSLVALGVLWLGGALEAGGAWAHFLEHWIGATGGVLVVAPFLLAFVEPIGRSRPAKWYAEAAVLMVALAVASAYVFTPFAAYGYRHYPLAFVPLPFVIWAAMRFEVRGTSVASLLVVSVALLGTLRGHGPFGRLPRDEAVLVLAFYAGMVAATGLLVAGAVAELRRERSLRSGLEVLRTIFDMIPVGLWILDARGRVTGSNPEAKRIWGADLQAAPRKYGEYRVLRLPERTPVGPRDHPLARAIDAGETHIGEEVEIEAFDGVRRVIRTSAMPLRDAESNVVGAIGVNEDITELMRREIEISRRDEMFRQLTANIPEAFWVRESGSEATLYVSPAWQQITGWPTPADRQGFLDIVHPDDYRRVALDAYQMLEGGADHEYRIVRPDGSIRWVHTRTFPIRNASGTPYRVAGVVEDVTEKKDAEEHLLKLAHYDTLTGLPNRNLFFESLKRLIGQAGEFGWVVGVMFLDLDRFKVVNDTLGHATGDELLRAVAARLLGCVRIRDVVGRLGGDEFALILPALESADDAGVVAGKVIDAFAAPFDLAGRETFVSASIGITIYPGDAREPDLLLRYADTAMYRAKTEGRNTFRFYTGEMNARALEKLDLENALRRALERGQFALHYQPKLDLASGRVNGVEALLRWRRSADETVAPAEFVPLLEETGLIVPVGEWVLGEACRQRSAWAAAGIDAPPIAINLSGRQFHQRDLVERFAAIVREHGVEPGGIEIELTESSVMSDAEQAVHVLGRLHDAGMRISVDDFGTGYSSLAYLKRFPIDAVKIDRSFIRDVVDDEDDAAITRAVIAMAHAMELRTVAEGVETDAQLEFLRRCGCDEVQGYRVARPMEAAAMVEFLRQPIAL